MCVYGYGAWQFPLIQQCYTIVHNMLCKYVLHTSIYAYEINLTLKSSRLVRLIVCHFCRVSRPQNCMSIMYFLYRRRACSYMHSSIIGFFIFVMVASIQKNRQSVKCFSSIHFCSFRFICVKHHAHKLVMLDNQEHCERTRPTKSNRHFSQFHVCTQGIVMLEIFFDR